MSVRSTRVPGPVSATASWWRAIVSLLITATAMPALAGQPAEAVVTFDPAATEIVVLATDHLNLLNPATEPVAVDMIRASLARFRPDLIVVEWLHPSVDRATAFNYAPLGDLPTLRRLWGLGANDDVPARISSLRTHLTAAKSSGLPLAATRIELGKAYYLSGDRLNAAYQWWRAGRAGADISDLRRLTRNNMAGHELEVWGFELAHALDHEYLTPFDYQGSDVGSEVWGEILERLRTLVLERRHGLRPGSPGYDQAALDFDAERGRFEAGESNAWVDRYSNIREVAEYVRAWRGYGAFTASRPAPDSAGLARIRWLQGDAYRAIEQRVNFELIPGISIGELGQRRTDGNVHRNQRMAEFADADIRRLGARRVLVIVGSGHKHFLEPIFAGMGYRISPSLQYLPGPAATRR